MNLIKPNKPEISEQISTLISPYSEDGTLLPKTAKGIFADAQNWTVKLDEKGEIIGFYQYREHGGTHLAEMGSVVSLEKGVGKCLLQAFETERHVKQAIDTGAFAVTKDQKTAYGFFQPLTGGDVSDSTKFPNWFPRKSNDRFFIQWR